MLLIGMAGCDRGPEKVRVHGIVRYQGAPLPYGSIMFQPLGAGMTARSMIGPDGTFQLVSDDNQLGVEPGRCLVRITAFEIQRQAGQGPRQDQEPTLGKSAIPKKYQSFGTSGIEIDVQPALRLPVEIDLD